MSEFLHDILSDRSNILADSSMIDQNNLDSIKLNLDKIRNMSLEDLDQEDKR